MSAKPEKFAELFNHPSVEAIYALSPNDFEHFVAYVLRRAGYDVKVVGRHWLRGVDLEMRRPGLKAIVGGVECKRYQPEDLVPASVVAHLLGAASVSKPGAKPYVITTSDFHPNAHKKAEAGAKHAHLMNGAQLVRYITYIRGSRHDDDETISLISPEYFCGRDEPTHHPAGAAKILTVANNKGGVGKTMTAYYLGAAFAHQGKRVLLIDLDGQANLTERCLPERVARLNEESECIPNIADYFAGERKLADLIISAETISGLGLIPSDPLLTLRDLGGAGRPDIERHFARDVQKLSVQPLSSLGGVPDWIIIDTPPALTVFTRAALAAAQYVLAPARPRPASVVGTKNVLNRLHTMNALTDGSAECIGAVVTHWDELKRSEETVTLRIRPALRDFGADTFLTKIPIDNQLEFLEPGAKTKGAQAYEALATEVLRYIQSRLDRQELAGATNYVNARIRREE